MPQDDLVNSWLHKSRNSTGCSAIRILLSEAYKSQNLHL